MRSFLRERPVAADAGGAAVLFAVLALVHDPDAPAAAAAALPTLALLAVGCAALAVRRRWPLATLVLTVGVGLLALVLARADGRFAVPVLVAMYTVADRTDRRTAVLTAVPVGILLVATGVLFGPGPGLSVENVGRFAWIGMAAAVGDAVRSSRAHLAAVRERAERAERTREEEALRRVAEERLRIARELHDVVAHHIAVVNVQAGAAGHLLATRPDEAAVALGHVRRAARTVLDELSGLLGVLREPDDAAAPTAPAPGLADLAGLVEGFRASGLAVTYSPAGDPTAVPPTVGVVAYRIVQEALTNAHRHGTGAATLAVVPGPTQLTVEVTNGLPAVAARSPGTGLGLIGMRERAAAVGGRVDAGPDADGATFRVRAALPLPPAPAGASRAPSTGAAP